ncbi:hypothetical protein [Pelagicoccus mobilis]|uniref:Carbohydrate-binding family 6 protein n=1 Tax=Pelagicoccus mobilis TaxID=415221 RepID=A0A934RUY4_9BACT|nr:hypothetical protein [Pelagicoccus mobilis]MBK1875296.1 hypothetical protein [Pelagicoccus mobilis]
MPLYPNPTPSFKGALAGLLSLLFAIVTIASPEDSELVQFGLKQLNQSKYSNSVSLRIDPTLGPQAYHIQNGSLLSAGDERGLMYGLFEIAERHSLYGSNADLKDVHGSPYISQRGIKFNIPLDARTPSYDDTGDAAQRNIVEMWNMSFWIQFLDQMALDRYNMLSLWNPHPFPSMVKLEKYPEVQLDDIYVTTLTPNGRENEWGEPQLVSASVAANIKKVKTLSIDEKISFWQQVMRHAKNRGIDIYWITWNICLNSVAEPVPDYYRTYGTKVPDEKPGKYGITHDMYDQDTRDYLRAAVKSFISTYPDIKGIGVTAGEHFPHNKGPKVDREEWLWDTYGRGILEAKESDPEREVRFIHRVWNTDFSSIMNSWESYPDDFEFSFKFAKARLYSSPKMPFADDLIEAMKPLGLKSWWNLRNDDIFVHRWGNPDYVRDFFKHFDLEATAGYHMGSDGYVWGREFVTKKAKSPRELEIHKHWYTFMLWGRLGYNPDLGDDYFIARLQDRFPEANSAQLYETWQNASKIIPLVNQFYWRNWDHMWSPENSQSHVEGYHGIELFADNKPMQGSGIQSIRDYVDAMLSEKKRSGTTPTEVSRELLKLSEETRAVATILLSVSENDDLRSLLNDCIGMSYLGEYYAHKIRAAIALATFQATSHEADKAEAIKQAQLSYDACTKYADHSQARYHPQMLARTGLFDWSAMLNNARKDVANMKAAQAQ